MFINNLNNIYFRDIFVSPSSSLKYSFKDSEIPFKLTKVAYK